MMPHSQGKERDSQAKEVTPAAPGPGRLIPACLPKDVSDEEPYPLVRTITLNGFEIVRPSSAGNSAPIAPREHRFLVRNPGGWEREVFVEITGEAVAYVERMARRRFPPESLFWIERAESCLADYLWNEGRFPEEILRVDVLSRDDLDIAMRWDGD